MKKLLLILLCFFSLNIITYASFPITESNTEILKTITSEDAEEDEPSLLIYILRGILFFSIAGFGLYFLIRAWWRAWRDDVRWVKILTYILLVPLLLYLILAVICWNGGCGYGN
jgi:hypothetical protein